MAMTLSIQLQEEILKLAKKVFDVNDQTCILQGPQDTQNAGLPVYRFRVELPDLLVTGYVGFDEPHNALNVWIASLT